MQPLLWLVWALSSEWTVSRPGEPLIEGQTARASHAGTGAGLVFRDLPAEDLPGAGGRRLRHLDLDAALSPVTLARAVEAEATEAGLTIAVGRGQRPGVGRWVYVVDERIWWQVFWEEEELFHQAIGWAPIGQESGFVAAMTDFERELSSDSPTLLFDAGRADCEVILRVDLNAALGATRQLEDVRTLLASKEAGPLAALRAGGMLDRHAERCVHAQARTQRACRVLEGKPTGANSRALQQAVVECLDQDPELLSDVATSIAPLLEGP